MENLSLQEEKLKNSIKKESKPEIPFKSISKPYFQKEFCDAIFNEVMEENLNSYDHYENIYTDTKSPLKMKIHLLSYKNKNSCRINKLRTEFFAPCSAKTYINIANDLEIQKQLDTYCDQYKVLEQDEEKKLLYISYRKTVFTSPRDFTYVKIIKNIQKNGKNYWCDAARSLELSHFPPHQNIIRCEILKSGHMIEDINENKCLVKIYSECDFKIDLPLFIIRNFSSLEMKKFIEKVLRKLKEVQSMEKRKE